MFLHSKRGIRTVRTMTCSKLLLCSDKFLCVTVTCETLSQQLHCMHCMLHKTTTFLQHNNISVNSPSSCHQTHNTKTTILHHFNIFTYSNYCGDFGILCALTMSVGDRQASRSQEGLLFIHKGSRLEHICVPVNQLT